MQEQPESLKEGQELVFDMKEDMLEMVQAVSKQALLFASVLFDLDGLGLSDPLAHQVGPGKGDGQEGDELLDSFGMGQMGRFQVEASGLECAEEHLNSPPFFVSLQPQAPFAIAGYDEELLGQTDACLPPGRAER